MPLLVDFGKRLSKSTKVDLDWKLDHYSICRANRISWPFLVDTFRSNSRIEFAGMFPRECEMTCIVDKLFPPQACVEFMGVNPTIVRLLQSFLDEDNEPELDVTPWRAKSPTQVGSGKLICRWKLDPKEAAQHSPLEYGIRVLEPYEQLRLIGWADSFDCHPQDTVWTIELLELLVNLAGNAFCICHW